MDSWLYRFCFINNIAVTARYLQKKYNINKVAIIDFDVHHGNGTQEIFYSDETVAYASSHEFPLFPGTGSEDENGVGNIFNAPLKLAAIDAFVEPIINAFWFYLLHSYWKKNNV